MSEFPKKYKSKVYAGFVVKFYSECDGIVITPGASGWKKGEHVKELTSCYSSNGWEPYKEESKSLTRQDWCHLPRHVRRSISKVLNESRFPYSC
jgi:hypothetical protein